MNKDELIFDWRTGDGHVGRNLLSWIVVGVLAMVIMGVVNVKVRGVSNEDSSSASVMVFADEGMLRYWTMKAQEDGPYPGGFGIRENDRMADLDGESLWRGLENWNAHEIKMKPFVEDDAGGFSFIERGKKYFPERRVVTSGLTEVKRMPTRRIPVISAYEKEARAWMPESAPDFPDGSGEFSSGEVWRFLLRLGKDGRVQHCMPLSGNEEQLKVLVDWVESIRFAPSEEAERWMGLRVEFNNVTGDDPGAK